MAWSRKPFSVSLVVVITLSVVAAGRAAARDAAHPKTTVAAVPGKMKRLPGGTFTVPEVKRTVTVQPFWLDETAVTAGAYAHCVKAGKCIIYDFQEYGGEGLCTYGKPEKLDHPMNCVDFSQASAYCTAFGKRLPTEEERAWATRGANKGTTHPWGNDAPRGNQICWSGEGNDRKSRGFEATCAVGAYPRGDSPQGVKDLAGNVYDWMWSPPGTALATVRGGSWQSWDQNHAAAAMGPVTVNRGYRSNGVGFRCAKSAQ
jgi:formylglycine-generating enzyme required for sulfatase activity